MSTTNSDFGGDLNGDGDTQDRFGVLYDRSTHRQSAAVDAANKYQIDDVLAAPEQTSDPGVA